jgi:membrane-bound lytic murein transglycosylase B
MHDHDAPFRRRLLLAGAASLVATPALARVGAKQPRGARLAKAGATPIDDQAPDAFTYGGREDVLRFADALAEKRGWERDWLRETLGLARFQPSVVRFIMPPPAGTAKNWAAYRARFVEPVRIRAGAAFWRLHESWLAKAEADHGVPPEVVVGILGVESIWGRQMGDFRILDALATLSFDFPTGRRDRSAFFRDELEAWCALCRQDGIAPTAWRGSYAGAFGMAQFMPSSYLRWAVDFDGDGRIDLHRSAGDAIGSVARYLAAFGWERGKPATFDIAAPVETSARATLLGPDILPTFTAARMTELGAVLGEAARAHPGPLALVELQNGDAAPTYVAGTTNFYAVTRYNWSSYYAMAVLDLGTTIKRSLG